MGGTARERVAGGAGEAGVEPADDAAFVPEQLRLEGGSGDAQVGLVEEVGAQAGVAVQLLDHPRAGFRVERPAGEQRGRVFAERPGLDLGHERLEIVRRAAGEPVEVARRDRVGREVDDVGQVVAGGELDGVELQHHRDQHDPVQVHVGALQVAREHRRAGGAVAFAEQVAGRVPALVFAEEAPEELRQGARVLVNAPEVRSVGAFEGMAETGADRIHHHDVRDVEEGVFVVLQRVGRRALRADLGSDHPARTHDAHVEPEGRRARPPVEGEDQRPLAGGRAVRAEVGGVEQLGGGFAVVIRQGGARHHRVVLDGIAAHDDGVAGFPAGLFGGGGAAVLRGARRSEQQQAGEGEDSGHFGDLRVGLGFRGKRKRGAARLRAAPPLAGAPEPRRRCRRGS